MAYRFFERKEHSKLYQNYMIREPEEIHRLVLSYLEEKKQKPLELVVDVGCGTGQSARILAPHFQKVVGVDISESQIEEASNVGSAPNVSYKVAAAELLPFKDESVDLITASAAAHFFNIEEFLREVDRALKPTGCLALYCLKFEFKLLYGDCSEILTDVFKEATDFLIRKNGRAGYEIIGKVNSQYEEIFNAVPYHDKTRVTDIVMKQTIRIDYLLGFFESLCLFQNFQMTEPEAAKELLCGLQKRFLKTMGTSSTDTELMMCRSYFCLLACKPA